jgi:hypothetical protein
MKKIVITLCIIGLILVPSTLSINISTSTKTKSSPSSEQGNTILITEFGSNGSTANVREFDREGNIIWQITNLSSPHDAERLPTGNTLITEYGKTRVIEVNRAGDIIWEYRAFGSSLLMDADRLGDGNTLISDYGIGRVIEIDNIGYIVWEKSSLSRPMDAERLQNGNTLIVQAITEGRSTNFNGSVIEVDREGNVVWSITDVFNAPVDVERLPNGNTLVTEHVGGNVTEYDNSGTVLWQKSGLYAPTDAERLENGNTLIAVNGANRVIETDPSGKTIWLMDGLLHPVDVEICSTQSPPTIKITNPKEGYFHLRDRSLFQFGNRTIVFGPANINVNITSAVGVERVEFFINDILEETIYGEQDSYEYRWAPVKCGTYKIKTTVYDDAGKNATDSIVLFKWRAHPILILTGALLLFTLFGN